jgi:hypothetical protein
MNQSLNPSYFPAPEIPVEATSTKTLRTPLSLALPTYLAGMLFVLSGRAGT